jgi:hypothetical protein
LGEPVLSKINSERANFAVSFRKAVTDGAFRWSFLSGKIAALEGVIRSTDSGRTGKGDQ